MYPSPPAEWVKPVLAMWPRLALDRRLKASPFVLGEDRRDFDRYVCNEYIDAVFLLTAEVLHNVGMIETTAELTAAGVFDTDSSAGVFEMLTEEFGRIRTELSELVPPPGWERSHSFELQAVTKFKEGSAKSALGLITGDTDVINEASELIEEAGDLFTQASAAAPASC